MRWPGAPGSGFVPPSAGIKLMIMTAGGIRDQSCDPANDPMS